MLNVLIWVASPLGLVIALPITLAVLCALYRAGTIRSRDPMSTTIATLALVVAGWSYFAQHTTMTIQSERNELALADMRGLLAFEASHDENWNVRLQKADGRPFQIDDLTLIPKYQVAREQGPIDGVPVPATPRRSTHDGNQVLEIPDALNRMCLLNETICAEHLRVIMITLDFTFDGSRYRIVANRPSS